MKRQWCELTLKKTEASVQNTRAITLPLGFTRNLEHAGAYTNVPSDWVRKERDFPESKNGVDWQKPFLSSSPVHWCESYSM